MYDSIYDLHTGHLTMLRQFTPLAAADECWLWTGPIGKSGYGATVGSKNGVKRHVGAHRVAYLVRHLTVPEGLVLDHLCRNRRCVNPAHLEPVSQAVNLQRQHLRGTCRKGHPFTEQSMYVAESGRRICRTCRRLRNIALRARRARIDA